MNGEGHLIRKMKNGDEEAMNQFVEEHYADILTYCRYHCSDRQAAQDMAQETFLRFFRSLAGYRSMGKASNYLYVIARNVCIDFGVRNRRIMEKELPEEPGNGVEDSGAVDKGFERLERKTDILCAVRQLPEEQRELIILHFFQGLSLKETASVLEIGLPLAKYRISRAKEQLRILLGEEE